MLSSTDVRVQVQGCELTDIRVQVQDVSASGHWEKCIGQVLTRHRRYFSSFVFSSTLLVRHPIFTEPLVKASRTTHYYTHTPTRAREHTHAPTHPPTHQTETDTQRERASESDTQYCRSQASPAQNASYFQAFSTVSLDRVVCRFWDLNLPVAWVDGGVDWCSITARSQALSNTNRLSWASRNR